MFPYIPLLLCLLLAACGEPTGQVPSTARVAEDAARRTDRADVRDPERAAVLRYPSLMGNIRAELHMLPPVSTGPVSPAWSPDGRWIAFAMAGDIWRIPSQGGTAEQLTQGPWYHFEPSWSPNGSRIAMTVETGAGLDIALLEVESGAVVPLVEGGGVDVQPAWSPDGRFVYFATAGRGLDVTGWRSRRERGKRSSRAPGTSTSRECPRRVFWSTWLRPRV